MSTTVTNYILFKISRGERRGHSTYRFRKSLLYCTLAEQPDLYLVLKKKKNSKNKNTPPLREFIRKSFRMAIALPPR